jgi:hypothetical protein
MLEEPRIRRIVGAGCDQRRRHLGGQLCLDRRDDVDRACIGDEDRDAVDDRIAPAARTREHIAGPLDGAEVDRVVRTRATTRANQRSDHG